MYFVYEFNLIPKREELQPLQELIDKLLERDAGAAARATPTKGAAGSGDGAAQCSACSDAAPPVAPAAEGVPPPT